MQCLSSLLAAAVAGQLAAVGGAGQVLSLSIGCPNIAPLQPLLQQRSLLWWSLMARRKACHSEESQRLTEGQKPTENTGRVYLDKAHRNRWILTSRHTKLGVLLT